MCAVFARTTARKLFTTEAVVAVPRGPGLIYIPISVA